MSLRREPGSPTQSGLPGSLPSLRPEEPRRQAKRVGLSQCGHPLTIELQKAIGAGLPVTSWVCRLCHVWRKINVYPDRMEAELLF